MKSLPLERIDHFSINSPAIIYSCEASGLFPATFISKNITRILGHKPSDFISTPGFWVDHIHPDDKEGILNNLSGLFETGFHHHEYRFRAADGTYRWFRDDLSLVRDRDGNPVEAIGCMVDITEEKMLAIEKQRIYDAEKIISQRQANLVSIRARLQEREQLLQDMHDGFGSQLAAAKVLASEKKLSKENFESILDECIMDLHLVCDTLIAESISVREAIVNYKYRMERRLEAASIVVNWELSEDENLHIGSQKTLNLLRILQEAFANSLKHSQATEINVKLSPALIDGERNLMLELKDNGVGLGQSFRPGRGIHNMQSRANKIGACLDIESNLPSGTKILLKLAI